MNATAYKARLESAEVIAPLWGAPDPAILNAGRRDPPPMPGDMFGALWPLIGDLAEGAGAPLDYVALSVLSSAASVIGGRRRVRPFESAAQWNEPCILWMALVGDPSSNKSPALDAGTEPLRLIEADHARKHADAMVSHDVVRERAQAERSAWQEMVKLAAKDGVATPGLPDSAAIPDEPIRRRLMVQDGTPEAVQSILVGNPTGTLHVRDELAGWLMSFERYSLGGREFWLEAYGGRPYVVDRKSAKVPQFISFNGVSVLGGVQPEKLNACLLSGVDDGLVARFLWAWPNPVPYHRPRRVADAAMLEKIYRDLDALRWGIGPDGRDVPVTLSLEPAAGNIFERWIQESAQELDEAGALFKGFCGKLKGMVLRLSLVAEYLKWAAAGSGPEPDTISAETLGDVLQFAEDYAKPSALRVFGDAILTEADRNAATLARYLKRHRLGRFNARTLYREKGAPPALRKSETRKPALDLLVDADWIRPAPTRQGDTPGRQSSDYIVNPAVLGGGNG